jgi:hypothetical protein
MSSQPPLRLGIEVEAIFVPKTVEPGRSLVEFASQLAESYPYDPGMRLAVLLGGPYVERFVKWEITKDATLLNDPTGKTCKWTGDLSICPLRN